MWCAWLLVRGKQHAFHQKKETMRKSINSFISSLFLVITERELAANDDS